MKKAIEWMTVHHVVANILMLLFIFGGLTRFQGIKQEIFPEISLDTIKVSVAYPGAGPEEVEEGIILKIEENITGIDGIKEITSVASEGMGVVSAELRSDVDANVILQDVKSEVDRITTFPEDAEEPVVTKMLLLREVISVVVFGDVSERTLREQAEMIRNDLLELPQITQVELSGVRDYEISIDISEENLRKYNLTFDDVTGAVGLSSRDLPGGKIKTTGGEILLRTKEKKYSAKEYENIIIKSEKTGAIVRLSDIAEVRDTFEDTDLYARYNDKPSAMIKVYRVANQKPADISEAVKAYVEKKNAMLPDSVKVDTWNDTSVLLKSRMMLLSKNAVLGLFLVIFVLGVFLEIRLAFWVMLGLPISFLGGLFLLPYFDVSINMISLFGFIMVLGIVVDDAIVVGENIYEHRQMGKSYTQAAIEGAKEMSLPVTFSILTTIAAFAPLLNVGGGMGKFMRHMPVVVISILFVSLIESLFVLPAHLAHSNPERKKGWALSAIDAVRLKVAGWLTSFSKGPFRRLLHFAYIYRYPVAASGLAVLLMSVGLVGGGIVKFSFMPEVEGDKVNVSLRMPPGTPVSVTEKYAREIISKGMETVKEVDEERKGLPSIFESIFAIIGGESQGGGPRASETSSGTHMTDIILSLTESEHRKYPISDVTKRWREKVGEIPGAESLTFVSNLVHMGSDIDIEVAHTDFAVLEKVAERLKSEIAEYPGVKDMEDSLSRGKKELKIYLAPEARSLGITETELARQIRGGFYGSEALRLQIGRNEVKVMARYPEQERKDIYDFYNMRIRTPEGGEIPIARAATIVEGRGFSTINRTDQKRVLNVTAGVDESKANASEILQDIVQKILPQMQRDFPGISLKLVGEEKERQETMESMKSGYLLALAIIFALLAIPFNSYFQPFIIMLAIPFGMVGAVLGHFLMGVNLTMLSLFGVVALSGVVVNDSLLIVDRINTNRNYGFSIYDSVIDAGQRRLRPILLTSLTTFLGLTPMILETSLQAQFLIPMAISLGFGILFATIITLILVPSFYVILEDIKSFFSSGEAEGKVVEDHN